jgi:hypothetical protein
MGSKEQLPHRDSCLHMLMGLHMEGKKLDAQGSGFRVKGSGFRIQVKGLGFKKLDGQGRLMSSSFDPRSSPAWPVSLSEPPSLPPSLSPPPPLSLCISLCVSMANMCVPLTCKGHTHIGHRYTHIIETIHMDRHDASFSSSKPKTQNPKPRDPKP